jgi:hypothetical protein
MDLFVCVVCVDGALLGALGLWLLAAAGVEDRKRSRGLVLFFLLVLFVSPLTFFEGVLCSHGFHESFGEGEVKEKLERYC